MPIQLGYDLLQGIFRDTLVFNISWVISLILTMITLMLLSRDPNKWKELAFPVMLGWHIAGVPPFFLMYIISAILFILEVLSLQTLGNLINLVRLPKKKKTMFEQELHKAKRTEMRRKLRPTGKVSGVVLQKSDREMKALFEKARGNR